MQSYYVTPTIEHCVCVVDALCRTGRFEEAESFIYKMPIEPTTVIWKAMLGAYCTHKDEK
jgi:pentatricopeptide repeat protein